MLKKPKEHLWQALDYPSAEAAREAGLDLAYKTYEWLHYQAEKAARTRLFWPYEDPAND